jgi:CheY-like chemotaxis protein
MNIEYPDKETILFVDDSPTTLELLFEFLTDTGFHVLIARNGESALQIAQADHPDLIFLDIIMPGMDGFETCRRLKNNDSTQDIPVIFMTALSQTAVVVKGFQLGAVDFIIKPSSKRNYSCPCHHSPDDSKIESIVSRCKMHDCNKRFSSVSRWNPHFKRQSTTPSLGDFRSLNETGEPPSL